jgi:ABC-2 type transport system permease protein
MSTVATPATSPSSAASRPGLGAVVRSEWTKLWSVRSTFWTLLALFVVTVGFSALVCLAVPRSETRGSDFDPVGVSLTGIFFGQVAAVVLGVLCITSEYSKGGIRTSLTAVPRRLRLIAAKAVVVAVVGLLIGLLTSLVSFELGQALLASKDADVALGDPQVMRAVLGGGLYIAACALFGYALGVLLRQSAGAITAGLVLLAVAPPLITLIPGSIGDTISRYFTSNAGSAILNVVPAGNTLAPWAGYVVFTLWWTILLALGAALMRRRDAA